MQSIDGLSEAAKIAYQAFIDMSDSKTAHFNCLKAVENIYESGGVPGAAETLELEKLLANHDKSVLAFKTAMSAVTDNDEKKTLIQLMT
ncbi:MAG: hypothetical protein WBO58_20420 [Gammaproteobacteria bacterium]